MGLLTWVAACRQKISPPPPAPLAQYAPDTVRPALSTLHVPVVIPVAEVARQFDAQLPDTLYEDSRFDDDNLLLRVRKNGLPRLEPRGDALLVTLPLTVWARAGYLGFVREADFALDVHFITRLAVGTDWRLRTQTTAEGYDWVVKPTLNLGFVEIPVASLLGNVIAPQQTRLAQQFDAQVAQHADLTPYVQQAWTLAQTPVRVAAPVETWLQLVPTTVQLTPLVGTGDQLTTALGITGYTHTTLGHLPAIVPPVPLPPLSPVASLDPDSRVALRNEISYAAAAILAKAQLAGQPFIFGKRTVEVTDLTLYGDGPQLIIRAELTGSLRGTVFFRGIPHYDAATQALTLQNLDYDLQTKSTLARTANWLLRGRFRRTIQEKFRVPIGSQLAQARASLQAALNQRTVYKGVVLNGTLTELVPDQIFLSPTGLVATLHATGQVFVRIEGL